MSFVKFFNYLLIFFVVSLSSIEANSIKKKCGDYLLSVEILNEKKLYERQFSLYYKKNKGEQLLHRSKIGYGFEVACVKSKENEYMVLFNEYCSGNSCPEYVYGLFDLDNQKILVKPKDDFNESEKQIDKILGYSPLTLDEKDFFCCNK